VTLEFIQPGQAIHNAVIESPNGWMHDELPDSHRLRSVRKLERHIAPNEWITIRYWAKARSTIKNLGVRRNTQRVRRG